MLTKIGTTILRTRVQLIILMLTCCNLLPNGAHAIPFSQISQVYFFGDSLTDSGFNNLTPNAPNKAPTFTTFGGYTWAQYVAHDIKGFTLPVGYPPASPDLITNNTTPTNGPGLVNPILTGVNYACGGSKTNSSPGVGILWAPSIHQQIAHFLSTAPNALDKNALYLIWGGANDILGALEQVPAPTQLQLLQTADTATTNIANEVALLSQRGAKRFVILSLPNIGSTPLITSMPDPSLPLAMKNLSFTFDSLLNQKLGGSILQYGIKVLYINSYGLLDDVITATKEGRPYVVAGNSFTFVNYTDQACAPAPSALFCPASAPTNYVFADSVHPTDQVHRILSLEVELLIKQWA